MKIINLNREDRHIDRAEAREIENEFLFETLNKVCEPHEFDDFKEWITEESDWEVFESSNRSWINTCTLRVISTATLYQEYLNARESQNQQS